MFEDMDCKCLPGIIVTPGDPEYEQARRAYNRSIQKYPLAVVYCRTMWDAANAVKWAVKNNVEFRIRGGGLGSEGYCVGNAVLVIDLGRLNAVRPDTSNRTVTVQGGALCRDLLPFLAASGCGFPLCGCPGAGVAGYALGGGWNYFCRSVGLGCDSLVSLRIVNHGGEILTASECENADLLWACRGGGGGNFGVIVSLTFRLPKKPGRVTCFTIRSPNADAAMQARFLCAWQEWLPGLDPGMTLRMNLSDSAEEDRAICGRGIYFGRPEEAKALLKPLMRCASMRFTAQYAPFARAWQTLGPACSSGEAFKAAGRFVGRMYSRGEAERIAALLERRPEGVEHIGLGLLALGGKVAKLRPGDTAFFYRDAAYILAMQAIWDGPAAADAGNEWVAGASGVIEPLTAGSFVNFPYDCLFDYEEAYYGGNADRLGAVKAKYDPENVFRHPQGIRPL